MSMKRMISKKLQQIDDNNDSLLQEPLMKKFIGVSQKVPISPIPLKIKNTLHLKFLRPELAAAKSTERRKIISVSPSATRISFFTKYNQSRLIQNVNNYESKNEKSKLSSIDSSKLVFKSIGSSPPKVNFIRRRLSMGTLKPKSQVERIMTYRRKNLMENPFRESLRQSDYI